jgi:hypothetical protein
VLKTYRYLRLAMVVLVVMLAASIAYEWVQTGRACWQTSISAYYFTPARAVFVSTLVAIGVCLVVLKGNTAVEDALLNLAGMLAPVVAFVPVPVAGRCRSVPMLLQDTSAAVANNVTALFVAGAVGLGVLLLVTLQQRSTGVSTQTSPLGVQLSAAVLVAGVVWFELDPDGFVSAAHYTAATGLFVCIVAVVLVNARAFARARRTSSQRRAYLNRYLVIAVVMVVGSAGMGLYALLFTWAHVLLWVEGLLITGFAVFWVSQTIELWNQGLRSTSPPR